MSELQIAYVIVSGVIIFSVFGEEMIKLVRISIQYLRGRNDF